LEHAGREREPLAQQRAGEAFAVSEVASGRVHGRQLRRFARQQLDLFGFTNKDTHTHTSIHITKNNKVLSTFKRIRKVQVWQTLEEK
jgi:hypothetical protein